MVDWTRDMDLKVAAALNLDFHKRREGVPQFITISRQFGCDGVDIADDLVERLNREEREHPWQKADREFLLAVEPTQLNKQMMDLLDQYGHSEFQSYLQEAVFRQGSQYQAVQRMANLVRFMARRGHVVFLGRGATVITRDFPTGVHVRLYAPEEWRVANYAKKFGVDAATARRVVKETQDKRDRWLQTYLAEPITNPLLYDAMINRAKISAKAAVDVIIDLLDDRAKLHGSAAEPNP